MPIWCTLDSRVVIGIFDFQKLASLRHNCVRRDIDISTTGLDQDKRSSLIFDRALWRLDIVFAVKCFV